MWGYVREEGNQNTLGVEVKILKDKTPKGEQQRMLGQFRGSKGK